ncbi:MAG: Holliday junction branch migration protein RuvA [Candidatus Saccharibacteria bacterium]|nr:Holliday junction branch migration protein RuvA [Candidatus Saccharibacteria bacterium]
MIAHIKGTVVEKFPPSSIIVDVGGVGYEINLTTLDFENTNLNDGTKFYTYHSIRENAEELYGFSTLVAKKLFELLISVQGIGPKAGMAILSLASPEEVRNAIANADSVFISKASGVGKKSAERVIVDLKDKVGIPSHYGTTKAPEKTIKLDEKDEALDALIALGFPLKEASSALADIDKTLSVEERVRQALKK